MHTSAHNLVRELKADRTSSEEILEEVVEEEHQVDEAADVGLAAEAVALRPGHSFLDDVPGPFFAVLVAGLCEVTPEVLDHSVFEDGGEGIGDHE